MDRGKGDSPARQSHTSLTEHHIAPVNGLALTSLSDVMYWRESDGGDDKKKIVWPRCFLFQEPCVEVTYFLTGGRRELGVLLGAAFGKLD